MSMQTTVKAAGMQATTMASQATAVAAMGRTAQVMGNVNKVMGPKAAGAVMQQFQRQQALMQMNEEAMDEMLADCFDDEEVDEEASEIVQETLEGIGIDTAALFDAPPLVPKAQAAPAAPAAAATAVDEDAARLELEARFAALSS